MLLVCSVPMHANMASPWQAGDIVGEPSAALDSLAVLREDLRIDLRPLARFDNATVEATYRIQNLGRARRTQLVFIAAGMAMHGDTVVEVLLDGVPMSFVLLDSVMLPGAWQVPDTTPGFDGNEPVRFQAKVRLSAGQYVHAAYSGMPAAIAFTLDFTNGVHTVRIRYRATATQNSTVHPIKIWQLPYVLAPARQWARFDSLYAVVLLPAGWQAAVSPGMARAGDSLAGAWKGVPADVMMIGVRRVPPSASELWWAENGPLIGAGVVGAILCLVVAIWSGRKGLTKRFVGFRAAGISIAMGLVCIVLMIVGETIHSSLAAELLGNQVATGYNYGASIAFVVMVLPITGLAATAITAVAFGLARFRGQRAIAARTKAGLSA